MSPIFKFPAPEYAPRVKASSTTTRATNAEASIDISQYSLDPRVSVKLKNYPAASSFDTNGWHVVFLGLQDLSIDKSSPLIHPEEQGLSM